MLRFNPFMVLFLFVLPCFGSLPDRITTLRKDFGSSEKIILSKGLASLLEFPKPIVEVRIGNSSIAKVVLSKASSNELTLFLLSEKLGPTNLIVRADKKIYVFDLIPSKSNHQDYVKVTGGFGSPSLNANLSVLLSGKMDFNPEIKPKKENSKIIESEKLE